MSGLHEGSVKTWSVRRRRIFGRGGCPLRHLASLARSGNHSNSSGVETRREAILGYCSAGKYRMETSIIR
jgi:hypothetical protein